MNNQIKTAVTLDPRGRVKARNARPSDPETARRAAARKTYRAKIESLLAEFGDEPLAGMWQRVCPFDLACELPDRRGIIEDLADFAEVLRPSLYDIKANRLCRLIEKLNSAGNRT